MSGVEGGDVLPDGRVELGRDRPFTCRALSPHARRRRLVAECEEEPAEARVLFLAFSRKLSPARRVAFGGALVVALVGPFTLFRGLRHCDVLRLPFLRAVRVPRTPVPGGPRALFVSCAPATPLSAPVVAARPSATDVWLSPVRLNSSRMRDSRKTS